MNLNESFILSNGVQIPKLGLGTWFIEDDQAEEAVKQAVSLGYRHFDTAQAYGNEAGVGKGVRNCGLPRAEIFVTSKVAAEAKSYEAAEKSIDESLEKMGLDYESLKECFPRLIYCHFTGYGHRGPDANRPGFDIAAF